MSRESVDDYGSSSDEGDDWEEVPSLAESAEAHKKAISDRIPESGLVITIPQGSSSGSSKPGKCCLGRDLKKLWAPSCCII